MQGDHYATAAFQAGASLNPLRFAEGSCFGVRSDCQIVPLNAPTPLAAPSILLGNTSADQVAVPQDPGWALKQLDRESKANMLDALLTRREETSDDFLVAAIDEIAKQPEFGDDLLVLKLQQLADRETPAVRAKACAALSRLKHPCAKQSGRTRRKVKQIVARKGRKPADDSGVARHRLYAAIPNYLVFTHFSMLFAAIDKNKVIAAFGLKWLTRTELRALKGEASSLVRELSALDSRAQKVTTAFRERGRLAIRQGKPLPSPPVEICFLQAMRTASMVNHAASLGAKLGQKDTLGLEAALDYQFATEINLGFLPHSKGK